MERNIRTNGSVSVATLLLAGMVVFAASHYCGTAAGRLVAVFLGLGFLAALISRFQMGLEEGEQREQLELDDLAHKSAEAALFKTAEAELRPAARAREQFEKFIAPAMAVVLLILQAGGAWWLWRWLDQRPLPEGALTAGFMNQPGVGLAVFGAVGLALFLLGKVAAGMAQIARQRLLRPGAGYLLLGAYLCVAAALAIGSDIAGYPRVDAVVARVMIALLGVAAIENAISLLFEIYRPRIKGAERRLMMESRLVGLASQPEGIFTTMAHALDYQFGFKVSETWFYQFLKRYLGFFVIAQAGILLLSSSVVFIEPGEQAILERFGRPMPELLNAGGHVKWPWPVDQVYRYRTDQIQTFTIGHGEAAEAEDDGHGHGAEAGGHAEHAMEAVLWDVSHAKDEYSLLVASREAEHLTGETNQVVPVNLLAVDIPLQYQVTNLLAWATNYTDGSALLERVANREVVRYLVNVDVNEILTSGRLQAAQELRRHIQDRANELNLGVRILFVGLQNIHPPVRIAPDYQKVVAALQEKEARIQEAQGYAAKSLPMAQAEATKRKAEAEIHAIRRAADAEAQAVLFTNRLAAWRASPSVFATRGYLQALVRGSAGSRKVVLAATNTEDVIILNLEDKLRPGIDDVIVPPAK